MHKVTLHALKMYSLLSIYLDFMGLFSERYSVGNFFFAFRAQDFILCSRKQPVNFAPAAFYIDAISDIMRLVEHLVLGRKMYRGFAIYVVINDL